MNRKVLRVIIVGSLLLGLGGVFKYHATKVQQRVRVEELVVLLSNGDVDVRLKAAKALSCMRSAALEPAVPALLGALSDQHSGVRTVAVLALYRSGRFGQPEDSIATTLIVYLDNEVPEARINAVRALGSMNRLAQPAVPALSAALRHEDADMRAAAKYALIRIEASVQEQAIAACREALRINPDYADAHNNLGAALLSKGKSEEAIAEFREALRINPDDANVRDNLDRALAHQGKTDRAVAEFREALRIDPDDADAHYGLGVALWQQGTIDEAIAAYRQSITLKPDDAKAHWNLAVALYEEQHFDEAKAHVEAVLRLAPTNEQAQLMIEELTEKDY